MAVVWTQVVEVTSSTNKPTFSELLAFYAFTAITAPLVTSDAGTTFAISIAPKAFAGNPEWSLWLQLVTPTLNSTKGPPEPIL